MKFFVDELKSLCYLNGPDKGKPVARLGHKVAVVKIQDETNKAGRTEHDTSKMCCDSVFFYPSKTGFLSKISRSYSDKSLTFQPKL